jgi:predicted PurR-regulated permease PerM
MAKDQPLNTKASPHKKRTYLYSKSMANCGIVALLVVVILIARVAFNVVLMVMAGALISTFFHGLGDLIERKTKLKRRWAMLISVPLDH